ncbi:MAG TPA: pyridoxal phosphate-dependent aminotransferase [Holophagaceae bacterium]|nr:pyridoxal phosphate-dependent aminotransferase [Holophagaceae bacterium]
MSRSSRLPVNSAPNALSAALARLRAAGRPILDLTVSNPAACGFDYPEAEIRAALGGAGTLRHEPDPRGALSAREAVARHHGRGLCAADLLLTASTSEAYALLFKLLGDPGDEVLVPSPSYPLFEWLARLEGLRAVPAPAWFHERWSLDVGALDAACTPRTRAVCVVNPNNPTGQFLSRAEWRMLTEFCARKGLALIVDEVFADFPLEPEADHLPTALEDPGPPCLLFVLSGLSKAALLPQVKLGWIAARGPGAAPALEDLEFIADQYLSVSAPAQVAAPALLRLAPELRAQALARAKGNLAALDAWLPACPGCSRLPVGGGWSVLLRRPALEDDGSFALRLLEREGVLAHPGHYFDLPAEGFLVLSLLAPATTFGAGLAGLSRSLASR